MSTLLIKFDAHGFHQIRQNVDVPAAKVYNDRDVVYLADDLLSWEEPATRRRKKLSAHKSQEGS
jgi:hypothetical protein